MSRFIRKVKTKSGATAVQIVYKDGRVVSKIIHIGSARNNQKLELLIALAKVKLHEGQAGLFSDEKPLIIQEKTQSLLLADILAKCYQRMFDLGDPIFKQLVIARLVEPTSKLDTIRVLSDLGLASPSKNQIYYSLSKIVEEDYRTKISTACFNYCKSLYPHDGLSLLLYDVTTLYFESQEADEFRKPGLSKERRLEPQIVVGLLVNRDGFPLEIAEFEGNKAETKTIIPVLESFYQKHNLDKSKITITADAGMLSTSNLKQLEDAGFHFIVGSRIAKTPYQIKDYQKSHPKENFSDNQIFETIQTFGREKQDQRHWRVIYQYKYKRAQLDLKNLEKQVIKAQKVLLGQTPLKKVKFLQVKGAIKSLDQRLIIEHTLRAGIKGYVTNLPIATSSSMMNSSPTSPQEIINAYHQLFQVEKSFRMSKSDLKARPIFHRTLDSIKAHLTIVFTALAIGRYIESHTSISLKKFIQTLKVIRTGVVIIEGKKYQTQPLLDQNAENLIKKLGGY